MKAPVLYLYLFGLVWAQSERQPHHKKAKCTGEHQIMVKGRNGKHRYYVFQYVYSSLMPSNQTWIKKEEDDDKSIDSSRLWLDKEEGLGKPVDNHTAEEKEEGPKNVAEIGIKSELEDRRLREKAQILNEHQESPSSSDEHQHHGNPSYRDIPQRPSGYILDKGSIDTATGDTAHDFDGSGDIGFLGHDKQHHGTISGNEHQIQGKDHQDNRGTEANSLWGRNEVGQLGISKYTKQSKGTHIKIGVKENETSALQEIILDSYLPKKSKASKSKDYLDVSVKVKNATREEPVKEEGDSLDSLDKDKEENASTRLQTHFNAQGKISGNLLGNVDRTRNERNITTFSNTDEIITVNEKDRYYTEVHKKGGDGYIVLDQKLDGQKVIYGETETHQKGEVRDLMQIEVVDFMKSPNKDRVKEDVINGWPSSHINIGGISKKHRTDEGEHMIESTINQVESSIFTQPHQTNQSQILSREKLNASGVTKSHTGSGGEVALLGRTSVSQIAGFDVINQSQKGTGEVGLIHRKSNKGREGFHFTKVPQNKADSHAKTNQNAHQGKQSDSKRKERGSHRLRVTFQEGTEEVVKGNRGFYKIPGTADLGVDSSGRKEEKSRHKSAPPPLAHGSQDYKHIAKSREHSSYTLKDNRKITEPSKRSSGVHNGRCGSSTSEQYRGHLGAFQRKSHHRHEKKGKSRKDTHASDSSQSSGSEGKSRSDSRQSYEDYQNDNTDSYQSVETVEENLSAGSNQRDDSSQMEDSYSREDSQEPRRN